MSKEKRVRSKISQVTRNKVARILRELRKRSGLNLSQVMAKTGINSGSLHYMELGRRCNPDNFKLLMTLYKAPKEVFDYLGKRALMELGYFSIAGGLNSKADFKEATVKVKAAIDAEAKAELNAKNKNKADSKNEDDANNIQCDMCLELGMPKLIIKIEKFNLLLAIQVLEEDERFLNVGGSIFTASNGFKITSKGDGPQVLGIDKKILCLRGSDKNADNRVLCISFISNSNRDKYYYQLVEALYEWAAKWEGWKQGSNEEVVFDNCLMF